jgi:hypothetical protein
MIFKAAKLQFLLPELRYKFFSLLREEMVNGPHECFAPPGQGHHMLLAVKKVLPLRGRSGLNPSRIFSPELRYKFFSLLRVEMVNGPHECFAPPGKGHDIILTVKKILPLRDRGQVESVMRISFAGIEIQFFFPVTSRNG